MMMAHFNILGYPQLLSVCASITLAELLLDVSSIWAVI